MRTSVCTDYTKLISVSSPRLIVSGAILQAGNSPIMFSMKGEFWRIVLGIYIESYNNTSRRRQGNNIHFSLKLSLSAQSFDYDRSNKSIMRSMTMSKYPRDTIDSLKIAMARMIEIMTIGNLMYRLSSHDLTHLF